MAELAIDLTYGTALFDAAKETGQTERIMEDASKVLDILEQEPDFGVFLSYPGISAADKKTVTENIFRGAICDELLNFIYILIDKRRTMHLEKIIKVYKKLMDKETGFLYGTVYSVIPLGDERIQELQEDVSKLLNANIRLTNEMDPKLMGGIKIYVDGKIIDASIRKRFADLNSQIKFEQGGKK